MFIQDEAFTTMLRVKKLAEDEFSPAEQAPALTKQAYDNRRINNLMEDVKSDYTDQVSLNQDILNKQYEIAVKRSKIQDELAQINLLWGALETRKIEPKEFQKASAVNELSKLAGFDSESLDAYMAQRFQ